MEYLNIEKTKEYFSGDNGLIKNERMTNIRFVVCQYLWSNTTMSTNEISKVVNIHNNNVKRLLKLTRKVDCSYEFENLFDIIYNHKYPFFEKYNKEKRKIEYVFK